MLSNEEIFSSDIPFETKAAALFRNQASQNRLYRRFLTNLGISPNSDLNLHRYPLLPIRAFRERRVTTSEKPPKLLFKSSGTQSMKRSVHEIFDLELARKAAVQGFEQFYPGTPVVWAYTPGYLEYRESSLVWMLQQLIDRDPQNLSRFIPLGQPLDKGQMASAADSNRQLILFGAAFGLLDLIELEKVKLPTGSVVIETGGMKTRRREIGRDELHSRLADGFGIPREDIHSEYGMCELLSQAYSTEGGWFRTTATMRVTIHDGDDPLKICRPGQEGRIGVVDLANRDSCSFVLTGDRGVADENGRFQVLGRWSPEDMRGCNFLIDRD